MDQISQWGFPFRIRETSGGPHRYPRFVGSDQGLFISRDANSISEAADWALDAMRQWAFNGLRARGNGIGGRNYFGRITRRWAKYGQGANNVPGSLGSTLDWLYFFSKDASRNPSDVMYPVFSHLDNDLFNVYCWVYSNLWSADSVVGNRPAVEITSDHGLHIDFWDSQYGNGDQTHHFAAFVWFGAHYGISDHLVLTALTQSGDAHLDLSERSGFKITNRGDALLGFLATRWGDRMRTAPGYLGHDIARSLRHNCGWPGGQRCV